MSADRATGVVEEDSKGQEDGGGLHGLGMNDEAPLTFSSARIFRG